MDVFLYGAAVLVTLAIGVFGWIALAFASLPGSSISHAWHARTIRGLFYTYPGVVVGSLSLLDSSDWSLLLCLAPVIPVFLVYLIFKIVDSANKAKRQR